jgi:hypothetical protein
LADPDPGCLGGPSGLYTSEDGNIYMTQDKLSGGQRKQTKQTLEKNKKYRQLFGYETTKIKYRTCNYLH